MAAPATPRRSILLVEDDPIHVEIIRFHLQSQAERVGDVAACTRFEEALERVQAAAPDLVLLDLTLPDSDLDETLERIPEIVASGATVVAMSSLGTPEIAETARARGAAAFVAKSDLATQGLGRLLDVMDGEPSVTGRVPTSAPAAPAPDSVDTTLATIAARLAHSANSWLTNQAFRLAALDALGDGPPGETDSPAGLREHVASLRQSTDALTDIVEAAREIVNDEATSAAVRSVDLSAWIGTFAAAYLPAKGSHVVDVEPPTEPLLVAASVAGLAVVFEGLLANAAVLRSGEDGPGRRRIRVEVRTETPGRGRTTIDVTDDGGAWGGRPEEPIVTGDALGTRDGFGLVRARRWMERMGGALEIVERPDVPGAFLVRLTFAVA